MRKLSLMAAIILGLSNIAFADSANNNLSVEIARISTLNSFVSEINLLHETVEKYILQTADTNPTISKIDSFYNINKNTWLNYDKSGYLVIKPATNYSGFIIDKPTMDEHVANYIQNSRKLDATGVVNIVKQREPDGSVKLVDINIYFPYSQKVIDFLNTAKSIKDGVVSYTMPTSSNVTKWYKPDGNGNFIVYQKDPNTGQWVLEGTLHSSDGHFVPINTETDSVAIKNNLLRPLIRVDSARFLEGKIAPRGALAIDTNGNMYVTDGEGNWYFVGSKVVPSRKSPQENSQKRPVD